MPKWVNTRLAVLVDEAVITPIESFTPSFSLNTEVLHSIEATHIGYVVNPQSFTFSMTVRAIGGAAATLAGLAMKGTEFSIGLMPAESAGDEWDFDEIILSRCVITSANPTNATINGVPQASFSGVALEAKVDTDQLPVFSGGEDEG